MEYIWILSIVLVIGLELGAIVVVVFEDILYEPEDKIKKVLFIIFVPIIGAIIELRKIDRYARYKKDENGNDVMCYAFWDYYTTSQGFGNSDSGGSFEGGAGGGGSD